MQYEKKVQLRNGEELLLKNATSEYQKEALENFIRTHEETDYLLSYPDETTMTEEQEGEFLDAKTKSDNEIEILALLDGKVVGTAGIDAVGNKYKISHRAECGRNPKGMRSRITGLEMPNPGFKFSELEEKTAERIHDESKQCRCSATGERVYC